MAVTFLEPGGDADFTLATTNGFWRFQAAAVATDFVHGGHQKSIKYGANVSDRTFSGNNIMADTGTRMSFWIYLVALPSAAANFWTVSKSDDNTRVINFKLTAAGKLQLFETTNQIGTDGATLATGTWYRISIAWTITSTTVNRFEVFVNGVSSISVTNATLTNTLTNNFGIGNLGSNSTLDFRSSDHYIDDSNALTDPGNIWVTAKRPNANGTTNNFNTQIGSGGSGYGTGHSPQVNERPLSTTNGWSVVAVAATTEEYNIEGQATGDISTAGGTIVDYLGWVSTSALVNETGSIIVNNASTNINITTTTTLFTKLAGSTTYPAGTGTDIGMITSNTATTVSLYECGVVVAFIPATKRMKALLGVGA
jgi:hypothetical protein